ncbi:MAG: beta-glucosidase BglX [Clostridia bacterium]|nr:beta-glucosidase BglX [Clostridia bacterium]
MDIKALLSKMTVEEKLAQMSQFNSNCLDKDSDGGVTGPARSLSLTEADIAATGSTLNFKGADEMIRMQDEHMKQDRLGIPLLFMMDVIHGFRTIYPIPLGVGASFDPDLMKRLSEMAAKEAAVGGVQVTFSPMVDLVRDARWGRCMESTGEDKYLNGLMAKAAVEGYQGDYSSKYNIAACVKHFAAYGAAESGRDYNSVDMSEYSLYNDYLPAYKVATDAGVDMLMTSFNLINGVPSSGNEWLLREVLRDRWGFGGIIISDYNAFREMKSHGFCADDYECARAAFKAGTDIEMMSNCYIKFGKRLLEEGIITEAQIDESVLRILALKDKLGMFDNPYRAASAEEEKALFLCPEHRALAREGAENSAVLLKNEGVLPISESVDMVAVIGPFADVGMIGFWSCHGKESEAVSAYRGMCDALGEERVAYAKGCDTASNAKSDEALLREAVELASRSSAVVLCLGEERNMSGESNSRADIGLSDAQKTLVREIARVNKNCVSVLYCGRPLALADIIDDMPACAVMWQPGTEGGSALANLLLGRCDFTARLPMSFPYTVGQAPIYYNRTRTGRPAHDEHAIGKMYSSHYLDCPNGPLFPFGYGLSYTAFEISAPEVSKDSMNADGSLTVCATVTNKGARDSAALVQLYIRDVVASRVRPVKELKGFERVELKAGESKVVSFEITSDMLSFKDTSDKDVLEAGEFYAFVGLSSDEKRAASFRLV